MALPLLLLLLLFGGAWAWAPDLDRATLEARYAAPPSEFAAVDGLRLHLRDSAPDGPATRPTLLLLHGFGSSLHSWDAWAEALAPRFRVLRFDLPGAGLTGPEPADDHGDERTLRLLLALLEARGVAQASVIGHSMGGRIAARFAAAHPTRVDRLVLVAPAGFPDPALDAATNELPLLARMLPHALPRRLVRGALEAAWGDPARLGDDTVTRYHDLLRAPGVRAAMLSRQRPWRDTDPRPWLAQVSSPTLLLWGSADRFIPPARAQDFVQALPQAHAVLLPGLGHLPQEEDAQTSLVPVLDFLLR